MTIEMLTELEEEQKVGSNLQGAIGTRIARYLGNYVDPLRLGFVFGDNVDFLVPGLGTKTKKPDAAFVTIEKLAELNDDPVLPFAPDLAVEVISRTDSWKDIVKKANVYLRAGTSLVWAVDPYTKSVFVFRPATEIEFVTLRGDDLLEGYDIIKGFQLSVNEVFGYPVRPDNLDDKPEAVSE